MAARRQPVDILELRLVLLGVNPPIWRRLLVPAGASVADLHDTLQIAMGWEDVHLHRFHIRGRDYGVSRVGGLYFADNAHDVRLGDLGLRCGERFVYEYDTGDLRVHQIRLERVPLADPRERYPRCTGGKRAAPPEDCGGPWAYMTLRVARAVRTARSRPDDGRQTAMTFHVQLTYPLDDGTRVRRDVADFGKEIAGAEDIGLTLAEAKPLLGELQRVIVEKQIERYLAEHRCCPECGRCRRLKGYHPVQFRTTFGAIELRSPRLHRCRCEPDTERTFSPLRELLGDHVAPELAYLEAKWASRASFAAATELIYVRGREGKGRTDGHFEVIAGKSIHFDGSAKCFAHVHKHDVKPKRRLFELISRLRAGRDEDGSGGEDRTVRKLRRGLEELSTYLDANLAFIPNYSDRYLHGERISTGFIESTVNQVVSKRFVKKQQRRWTAEGAHLLLQVRTRELNGDLEETFRHWHPRFRTDAAVDQDALVS